MNRHTPDFTVQVRQRRKGCSVTLVTDKLGVTSPCGVTAEGSHLYASSSFSLRLPSFMAQWGQGQPQFTQQTGFNPQMQTGFGGGIPPQPTGFPGQRPGFFASQPTGLPGVSGFSSQPTGYGQQQAGFLSQQPGIPQQPAQFQQPMQTGFPGQFGQQRAPPPVPPIPSQFQQHQSTLQPQQQNRFLSSSPSPGMGGTLGSGLVPQPTGFPGGGGLAARPLVAQPTGYVDPRLVMMSNTFMPANPSLPYQGGVPQFQPQTGPSLQQNFQQHNQIQRGTAAPRVPWTLSRGEKKSYDQIFRAWDASGSGFITGQTALEVFGQSGLDKNDLAMIWYCFTCCPVVPIFLSLYTPGH